MVAVQADPASFSTRQKQAIPNWTDIVPVHAYQSVIQAMLEMQEAIESLAAALPQLDGSFSVLFDAIAGYSNDLTRYKQSLLEGAGVSVPYPPIPEHMFQTSMEIVAASNEVLRYVTPFFPILSSGMLIVAEQFPDLANVFPAIRSVGSFAATFGSNGTSGKNPMNSYASNRQLPSKW